MALFGNIEDNIVELLKALSQNKDFIKLISIDEKDALSQSATETFSSLIDKRLFMKTKVELPTSEEKSFVSIYLKNNQKVDRNNIYQYDTFLIVDVMCHNNLWDLDNNKTRPYRLVDVLHDTFKDVKIKSITSGLTLQSNTLRYYSDDFRGYTLVYKYTGNINGCS